MRHSREALPCEYAYWLVRPSQADAASTTPIGLPDFPSYVSRHAGFSRATAEAQAYLFPAGRAQLAAQAEEAEEAAMSRRPCAPRER